VAAIAGIYEHPHRVSQGQSPLQIKAQSAIHALAEAGLTLRDVDALFDAGETSAHAGLEVAEYLGVDPSVMVTTDVGGSSFEVFVGDACRAIACGDARVALLTYAETPRTNLVVPPMIGTGRCQPSSADNAEAPFGMNIVANYALVAARHQHQYGTTPAQLAEIAVTSRAHAQRNPMAMQGLVDMGLKHTGEITVDDVVGSRMIADPLHLLDCCLVSDGGGAVVIVAADMAEDRPTTPVWVLSSAMAAEHQSAERDITVSAAARSGPAAFARAGVTPADVDVAMLYDSFTITVLVALEDLGFCAKGEGGAYVEGGRLRYDHPGGPALNTDGGGLSSNHPGMRGLFLLIEAARQLRGESTAQVEGAQVAVAHGNGVLLGSRHVGATVVLGRRPQ
jgi:acetyl-CoA C-acetyltransferase